MARGSEGKAARKKQRAEARIKETERLLPGEAKDVNEFEAPPSLDVGALDGVTKNSSGPNIEEDSSSDDDDGEDEDEGPAVPEQTPEKKKKSKSARAKKKAAAAASRKARSDDCGSGGSCCGPSGKAGGSGEGIKTLPLVMLVMLTATTVLPALLYMGDWVSNYMQRNHIMGGLGNRLGIGNSPKKRVLSFYEKHDPEKIGEVPKILSKYYGDYPKLVKRLERKYQDYGYFMHWEDDEAPMKLAMEKVWETHEMMSQKFDRYAPAVVKTGARNVRHNFTTLYKKGNKTWKKQIWPLLEPHFGVPDAKTARKQKLKDKKEADKRKREATGQRGKRSDFRDDDHDEM